MTQRYILLTALFCAASVVQVQSIIKSPPVIYHISAADVATGVTLTDPGCYLLEESAITLASGNAITVDGNDITVDLCGFNIIKGGSTNTAIAICNDTQNIIVKNGNIFGNFLAAVTARKNGSNILIEDIEIDGSLRNGIDAFAASGNEISNLTLRNVIVSNCAGVIGNDLVPFEIRYINGLVLEDVTSNNSSSATQNLSGIKIRNSNNISATNVTSTNHKGKGGTRGMLVINCNDVTLTNINVSNQDDHVDGAESRGLVLINCDNLEATQISANNLIHTDCNLFINNVNNTIISDFTVLNSTSGSGSNHFVNSIKVEGSDSLLLRNGIVSNNSVSNSYYRGLRFTDSCSNITVENIDVLSNSSAEGLIGLNAGATTTNLEIKNSNFNLNTSSTNLPGTIIAGVYIDNVDGCAIIDSEASFNTGASEAHGFYLFNATNVIMTNFIATGNVPAV